MVAKFCKLIVIDGPDKVGKQTQTEILAKRLGVPRLEYPNYTTESGKQIDNMLKSRITFDKKAMQTLQAQNKLDDLPMLYVLMETNTHIVIDRYMPSAMAYGVLDGFTVADIVALNFELPPVDVVIILSGENWTLGGDYNENVDRQSKVKKIYHDLAHSHHWFIVNSNQTREDVASDIWKIVERYL
jgi:dTMP kinase